MNKLYIIALVLGFSGSAQAAIVEKPLKLEGQADNDRKDSGAIVFPPATEPYQPVETTAARPVTQQPQTTYQGQPVAQPQAYQQPMVQPAYQQPSNASPSNNGGGFYTREMLERAADNCEAELGQLWQQKGSVERSRQRDFQLHMGKAKQQCDHLREASKALKQADYSLYTYQNSLQQAQLAMH